LNLRHYKDCFKKIALKAVKNDLLFELGWDEGQGEFKSFQHLIAIFSSFYTALNFLHTFWRFAASVQDKKYEPSGLRTKHYLI